MPATRVTLKQIAEAAGVSVMTASNALNGVEKGIRTDALKRADHVRNIAQKLGYRPNGAAKAMVTGRFGAIGLLSSTEGSHSVIAPAMPAIQAACREHNLLLALGEVPDEQLDSPDALPKVLREWSVDGLLINYAYDFPPAMREHVRALRIPSVWVNVKHDANCVHPDDEGAGHEATRRLLEAGHQRIAYVTFAHSQHYSHEDRAAGYERAMRGAGLTPRLERADHYLHPREIEPMASAVLSGPDRPTAVVTYGGGDAASLAWHALNHDLKVPRDLSLVAIDHAPPRLGGLEVCACQVPFEAMGREAVDMLTEKLVAGAPRTRQAPRPIPFAWIEGTSICPPAT